MVTMLDNDQSSSSPVVLVVVIYLLSIGDGVKFSILPDPARSSILASAVQRPRGALLRDYAHIVGVLSHATLASTQCSRLA